MKKTISNSSNLAQYCYGYVNGKVKMTKSNSALSLIIKKYGLIRNESNIEIHQLEGLILSKALTSLKNTGQITDFYNEFCKISRNFKSKWQLNRHILKMISSSTTKEWRTFLKRKSKYI